MSDEWRRLEAGEIIEDGDQYDAAADRLTCNAVWWPVRVDMIATVAPDPRDPANRIFRRRVAK